MESFVVHGVGTEWEDLKEEVTCGSYTSCLRYSNIRTVIDQLVAPGSAFDYEFLNRILMCLPSISTPLEVYNCLTQKLKPPDRADSDCNVNKADDSEGGSHCSPGAVPAVSSPSNNKDIQEQIQMKVLICFRCWVNSPYAYADMSSGSILVRDSSKTKCTLCCLYDCCGVLVLRRVFTHASVFFDGRRRI